MILVPMQCLIVLTTNLDCNTECEEIHLVKGVEVCRLQLCALRSLNKVILYMAIRHVLSLVEPTPVPQVTGLALKAALTLAFI